MADIFISYASSDVGLARALAEFLLKSGYSVWWDYEIAGGAEFREQIETELRAASCAIVIWTPTSIKSRWVIDEAEVATRAKRLIPLRVDSLGLEKIPIGFGTLQTLLYTERDRLLRTLSKFGIEPAADGQASIPATQSIGTLAAFRARPWWRAYAKPWVAALGIVMAASLVVDQMRYDGQFTMGLLVGGVFIGILIARKDASGSG